jgi:YegS/Rv2252/BmrU family lipid kinase
LVSYVVVIVRDPVAALRGSGVSSGDYIEAPHGRQENRCRLSGTKALYAAFAMGYDRGVPLNVAVIINPRAGRKSAAWPEEALRSALADSGIRASVHRTSSRGDAGRLAAELAPRADAIAVVGGDGTVHEVANGIRSRPVPVAILPTGSGNDLSSLIECPRNPRDLAQVLRDGWAAELDLLDFGDRYCVNSAGLGFEGLVNRMSHGFSRVGGRTRYAIALLRALRSVRFSRFTITASTGERISGEKLLVSIGNGQRTGGAFYLTPHAFPDDGVIDVCVVDRMSRLKMLRVLPSTLRGNHVRRSEVRMLRAESLVIEATAPYPMHIDGEYFEARPERREVTVKPAAFTMLCRRSARNRLTKQLKKIL